MTKKKIHKSTQSKTFLPEIYKAQGKYVQGKNKEYLDFIGGNNTVILGHKQFKFDYCPNFSGPSFLEDRVSHILSGYTDTDYFRYFKNGTDAVNCAIRLARYLVNKKHLVSNKEIKIGFIGYGGTGDEYVRTFNENGTLECSSIQFNIKLISKHNYESDSFFDILVYESRYSGIAGFIKAKYKICDHLKSGILGLDENRSDIDLYGKSIANGYPVAVMTGKDEIMEEINNIYYSTTFGGDNIGLEAIIKTINEFYPKKKNYLKMKQYAQHKLPKWKSLKRDQVKKFLEKGVFFNGNWQLMTCHSKRDIDRLASLCDELM